MTRRDQYGHLLHFSKTQCLLTETILVSPFRQPEASDPVDTQRPTWSLAPFVEDLMSIDRDYFSLYIVIQRQSSPMTRRDQHGP